MGKILNVINPHHRKIMSLDLQNWVTFMTQMCMCVCSNFYFTLDLLQPFTPVRCKSPHKEHLHCTMSSGACITEAVEIQTLKVHLNLNFG